jgi:hypothetical protein
LIVLIGNSPSSGSTLLADLLDSARHCACGEEIGLFSLKNLYDFNSFKKNPVCSSKLSSIYFSRATLRVNDLHTYGLNFKEYIKLLDSSDSFESFCAIFSERFLALRGKPSNGIVFEKTPNNINCISEFLDSYSAGRFVFLVRNPVAVYRSLVRRGFARHLALLNWFIDTARVLPYINHPRLTILSYEELLRNPFETVSSLIEKLTASAVDPEDLRVRYENNRYRQLFAFRHSEWTAQGWGVQDGKAITEITDDESAQFALCSNLRVSSSYARMFKLSEAPFSEMLKEFGYERIYIRAREFESTPHFQKSKLINTMYKKWKADRQAGDASFRDVLSYLLPVCEIDRATRGNSETR